MKFVNVYTLKAIKRFVIRQSKMPISQVLLAELLICIVTAAVVRECAGERCGVRAYIDPGTGSFAIQALIAGLTGLVYLLRRYWRNIGGYIPTIFHRKRGAPKKS